MGDNEDCTGFLYMPRRPFHWHINKHKVHTFASKQLGLMSVMRARIAQSSCTSGRPIFPAAPAPPYAVTLPELDEL